MQNIDIPLSNPVAAGATFTGNYPSGKSRTNYIAAGAILFVGQNQYSNPTISLGASTITITNPTGATIASGTKVRLSLKSPQENAGLTAPTLATYAAHIEYPGSPVGNLTPDFVGQWCQDTTTGVFYDAQGATSSDWTANGSKNLPSMFIGTASASVAGGEIFNVTRVDTNADGLTRPLMSLFEHAVAPATAPGVTTDFHCVDARVYGSSANIDSFTRFYCIEGKATCQKPSGSMARTVGVMGSSVMTGAGTVNLAVGLQTDVQNTGAGTITEGVGVYIPNAVNSGGGTLTTAYGIKVENQTAGATNYSIYTSQGRVRFFGGTAIPAGGTAGVGVAFSSTSNFGVFFGSGAPSLAAAKGSLYLRSDGSTTNDRAYINTNGGSSWTALITAP